MKKSCFKKKLLSVLLSSAVAIASISVPTTAAEDIQLLNDTSEVFMEEEIPVLEAGVAKTVGSGNIECEGSVHRFENENTENQEETCICGEAKLSNMVAIYNSNDANTKRYFTKFGDAVTYIKGLQQHPQSPYLEIRDECNYYDNIEFDYTEITRIYFATENATLKLNNASLKLKSVDEHKIGIEVGDGIEATIENESNIDATFFIYTSPFSYFFLLYSIFLEKTSQKCLQMYPKFDIM